MSQEGGKEKELTDYEFLARNYEFLLNKEDARFDKTDLERKIKVLRIVGSLSEEEIDELFDTTAFNEILYGYFMDVIHHCVPRLTKEQKDSMILRMQDDLEMLGAVDARDIFISSEYREVLQE